MDNTTRGTTRSRLFSSARPSLARASAWLTITSAVLALAAACGGGGGGTDAAAVPQASPPLSAQDAQLSPRELLGKQIFNDTNLSEPRGTACVNCHQAASGFSSGNGLATGVAQGSLPGAIGLRNPMNNSYTGLIPTFGWRVEAGDLEAIGGLFWDGRADTQTQQALGPFLNPIEMNNASAQAVVAKIAQSSYAPLFRSEFGATVFDDPTLAYQKVGEAIAAFENSAQLQAFSSKYDAMVRGQASFTAPEQRGMALFMDSTRANCAGCHLMNPASRNPLDSPFSEFTYYATGVPRNTAIPRNADPSFFDLGLCGPERGKPALPSFAPADASIEQYCGKFRMPSLRNVAQRPALMHNGFFKDLRTVVQFYSTRDTNPQRWYGPAGVPNDLPVAYLGNIERAKAPLNRPASAGPLLAPGEVDDLVAFLRTLSDGYVPAP